MINQNSFLEKCQQLKNLGCEFVIEPGVRLGRGFADYGYEEFYFLNTNKTVSLLTGQTSEWQPVHQKFFFVIPDQFTLLNEISLKEAEIVSVEYLEQRDWIAVITHQGQEYKFENAEFDLLLIEVLLHLYDSKS